MRLLHLAVFFRTIYFFMLVFFTISKNWGGLFLFGGVFIISLLVFFHARTDERFFIIDSSLMLLFILIVLISYLGVSIKSSVFGVDKIFHFLGGVILCFGSYLLLEKYINSFFVLLLCSLAVTIFISTGWEVFELINFFFFSQSNISVITYIDSMLDIIAGGLGALLVLSYLFLKPRS